MEVYVLRHGETTGNALRIMDGRTDVPLTEKGEEQAKKAGEILRGVPFTRLYCSPLSRTRRTMELALGRKAEFIAEPRLIERDCGSLVGRSFDDVDRDTYWNYYRDGKVRETAEPLSSLFLRVYIFLDELKTLPKDEIVLLSTHLGVTRAIHCYLHGIPEDGALLPLGLGNAEIMRFTL